MPPLKKISVRFTLIYVKRLLKHGKCRRFSGEKFLCIKAIKSFLHIFLKVKIEKIQTKEGEENGIF